MHRANALRLALRLLFIHYYSYPRCEIRLPARKRANENARSLRIAAAPGNLARACRGTRAHARVRVRLSCEYRVQAGSKITRLSQHVRLVCVRTRLRFNWSLPFDFYTSREIRRGRKHRTYSFFSTFLSVILLKICSSFEFAGFFYLAAFDCCRGNCTIFSREHRSLIVYFGIEWGRFFFTSAFDTAMMYITGYLHGSHSGATRYMSSRAMVHSTVARTPRTQRG